MEREEEETKGKVASRKENSEGSGDTRGEEKFEKLKVDLVMGLAGGWLGQGRLTTARTVQAT